jgi:hypothetical protein
MVHHPCSRIAGVHAWLRVFSGGSGMSLAMITKPLLYQLSYAGSGAKAHNLHGFVLSLKGFFVQPQMRNGTLHVRRTG